MTEVDPIEALIARLLEELGEDTTRAGLVDTPARVARMWRNLVRMEDEPPGLTWFPKQEDGVDCDQMVVLSRIPFYSLCEHHMVPFFGQAHVGYLPHKKVVGLSKIARVVRYFAARLQVQERLTSQVAAFLHKELEPTGVCVLLEAEHLCMSMRGVQAPGHITVTHAIRGNIDKTELLDLVRRDQ